MSKKTDPRKKILIQQRKTERRMLAGVPVCRHCTRRSVTVEDGAPVCAWHTASEMLKIKENERRIDEAKADGTYVDPAKLLRTSTLALMAGLVGSVRRVK